MVSQGDKQQVAVRVPLHQKAELEREAAERGISRSEYIRTILTDRHRVNDLEELFAKADWVDELEADLEHTAARVEDLRRQLQAANEKDERVQELATYVEDERRVEQQWREAGLLTKTKWKVFGMPGDEDSSTA